MRLLKTGFLENSVEKHRLAEIIGHRSRVSELMNHKRRLSISAIRKLHAKLKIPAETLIKEYPLA